MAEYRFVADGAFETDERIISENDLSLVDFSIYIDDVLYKDEDKFDKDRLIKTMRQSKNGTRSACPSPEDFLKSFQNFGDIFVITISSALSGAYNSAVLAKEFCLNKNSNRRIHVFDSKSAGPGETQVYFKLKELIKKGLPYEKIVEETEKFINSMKTFFILENFDNLVKNGRVSKVKGFLGSILHFYPIMIGKNGVIELLENIRGKKKSIERLAQIIKEMASKMEQRILTISHVNALESVEYFLKEVGCLDFFKDVRVFEAGSLVTTYANEGGMVVCL